MCKTDVILQASDVLSGMLKKAGYVAGAKTAWPAGVPQLPQLFYIGQLVRCIVVDVVRRTYQTSLLFTCQLLRRMFAVHHVATLKRATVLGITSVVPRS